MSLWSLAGWSILPNVLGFAICLVFFPQISSAALLSMPAISLQELFSVMLLLNSLVFLFYLKASFLSLVFSQLMFGLNRILLAILFLSGILIRRVTDLWSGMEISSTTSNFWATLWRSPFLIKKPSSSYQVQLLLLNHVPRFLTL